MRVDISVSGVLGTIVYSHADAGISWNGPCKAVAFESAGDETSSK